MEGIRIRLVDQFIGCRGNTIFINIVLFDARDEQFPDPVGNLLHRVITRRPVVEIADNGNRVSVRRPDAEHRAGLAVLLTQMRTKIAVGLLVIALPEQINGQVRSFGRLFALLQRNLPFWGVFTHVPCIFLFLYYLFRK